MHTPIVLLILFFMTTMSCSSKNEQSETQFLLSSVLSLEIQSAGGLYFVGKSSSGKEFRHGLGSSTSELILTLDKDEWDFYTIAWEGPGLMEGAHRCNITSANLRDDNTVVSIQLSKNQCDDARLVNNSVDENIGFINKTSYLFHSLNLNPCLTIGLITTDNRDCRGVDPILGFNSHPYQPLHTSYRVRPITFGDQHTSNLTSRCFSSSDIFDHYDSKIESNIRLPIGGSLSFFEFEILAFKDSQCLMENSSYRFTNIQRGEFERFKIFPSSDSINLYFNDSSNGSTSSLFLDKVAHFDCANKHCLDSLPDDLPSAGPLYEYFNALDPILSNKNQVSVRDIPLNSIALMNIPDTLTVEIFATTNTNQFNNYSIEFITEISPPQQIQVNHDVANSKFLITLEEGLSTAEESIWNEMNALFTAESLPLQVQIRAASQFVSADNMNGLTFNFHPNKSGTLTNTSRSNSTLKRIASALSGNHFKLLEQSGYATCHSLPISNSINLNSNGVNYSYHFKNGKTPLPANLGLSVFPRHITLMKNNSPYFSFEFDCDAPRKGWIKFLQDDYEEIFWNTQDMNTAYLEVYSQKNNGDSFVTRLTKTGDNQYSLLSSIFNASESRFKAIRAIANDIRVGLVLLVNDDFINEAQIDSLNTTSVFCRSLDTNNITDPTCGALSPAPTFTASPHLLQDWISRYTSNIIQSQNSFITRWNTFNPGVSGVRTITLPLHEGYNYNFHVSWGDGTVDHITSWDSPLKTHTYSAEGTYDVMIWGALPYFAFKNEGDKERITSVLQWGNIQWQSMEGAFWGCINLAVETIDAPDLSLTTSLSSMFRGSTNTNKNIYNWDVSNIVDASYMFWGISNFNGNIEDWSTSSFQDISYMFYNNQTALELNSWDVSNVVNMVGTFSCNANLLTCTNPYIENWNVSAVEDMSYLFSGNVSFNRSLANWDTRSVVNFNYFLSLHRDEQGLFFIPPGLQNFDTSNAQSMEFMFSSRRINYSLGVWDVSKVTSMRSMFSMSQLQNDLADWDLSSLVDANSKFRGTIWDPGFQLNLDYSNVQNFSFMFSRGYSFGEPYDTNFNQDISSWNVSNAINMSSMFQENQVYNHDLSSWDVSNVVDFTNFAAGSTSFEPANQPIFASPYCISIGNSCEGGILVGNINITGTNYHLISTPGGCDSAIATPTCSGGPDNNFTLSWREGNLNISGATSTNDGPSNTALILSAGYTSSNAATYCDNLMYGGFTDWYLPAIDELDIMYQNRNFISGLTGHSMPYWSSTELTEYGAAIRSLSNNLEVTNKAKTNPRAVRCLRRVSF
jgi:hypothetical protein